LWAQGLRYRLHVKRLPGTPDIVFPTARVAVFVDGDFWHGNQWRLRGHSSIEEQFQGSPNATYWIPKIKRNVLRDSETDVQLRYGGWLVLRFWESEIKSSLESCVQRVVAEITERKKAIRCGR
jgi:DNA mismatch endonuclease (patch repair protein)